MKIKFGCHTKLFTNNFSEEFSTAKLASDEEIIEFLLRDCGVSYKETERSGELIPGDHNIWYLATGEKWGWVQVGEREWNWGIGESSWEIVNQVLWEIKATFPANRNSTTELYNVIQEGEKNFDCYTKIAPYLISKIDGTFWKRPEAQLCVE